MSKKGEGLSQDEQSESSRRRGEEFNLGPVVVRSGLEAPRRMSVLIWGAAATGKTTFAATAPGNKLWLSFGDQEHVSVAHRPDVKVADYSGLTPEELFKHANSDNPFGLDKVLAERPEIQTVVCDSVTMLVYNALQHSIKSAIGAGRRGFVPTIEEPGQAAYGARNALTLRVLGGLLRVTGKHGVHFICTAHEADPIREIVNGKETTTAVCIMLGGQLANHVTSRLSEIWYMSVYSPAGKTAERRLAIRSVRLRRPVKTRMFSGKTPSEFALEYDADKPDKGQMTIAGWYDEWRKRGEKIVPRITEVVSLVQQTQGSE